jgi:hypothetical protein
MSNTITQTCKHDVHTQKFVLIFILMFLLVTASSVADANKSSEVAYVDSVTEWGAWELDIEPAAGGLTAPSSGALHARDSRVALRTNSIAALAPTPPPVTITNTPIPAPPAAPSAIPTVYTPTVTYVPPGTPVPVGAP